MLFRDLRDPLHDLSIGLGCRIVLAFPTRFDRFRTVACVRTTSHSSVFRIRDTSIPVFPSFVYSIVFHFRVIFSACCEPQKYRFLSFFARRLLFCAPMFRGLQDQALLTGPVFQPPNG